MKNMMRKITENSVTLRHNKKNEKLIELKNTARSVLMTLNEDRIVFNINNIDYKFENVKYGYLVK